MGSDKKQPVTPAINFIDSDPKVNEDGTRQEGTKIIFLDLEGPIVTHRTIIAGSVLRRNLCEDKKDESFAYTGTYGPNAKSAFSRFVDKPALGLVLRAAQKHGARIVITSTLRSTDWVIEVLQDIAEELAQSAKARDLFHPDWRTPSSADRFRVEEIDRWLAAHKSEDITHWAAVDDINIEARQHFVRINSMEGITYRDYMTIQHILSEKPIEVEAIFI